MKFSKVSPFLSPNIRGLVAVNVDMNHLATGVFAGLVRPSMTAPVPLCSTVSGKLTGRPQLKECELHSPSWRQNICIDCMESFCMEIHLLPLSYVFQSEHICRYSFYTLGVFILLLRLSQPWPLGGLSIDFCDVALLFLRIVYFFVSFFRLSDLVRSSTLVFHTALLSWICVLFLGSLIVFTRHGF